MIQKIPVQDLKPGMRTAVVEDSAWLQEPGLYAGAAKVLDQEDIRRIVAEGYATVCVQAVEGECAPEGLDVEQYLAVAQRTYLEAFKVASRVVIDAAQGNLVDVSASRTAVRSMLQSVEQDADALAYAARMTTVAACLSSHMVNVTTISLAFGSYLGLTEKELLSLGLAAFLHDIGMTRLSLNILCSNGPLSESDAREVQKHPRFSVGMLRSVSGLSRRVRSGILQHHEHHDGSGYPEGLAGKRISDWARIIHLADVYDNLVSGQGAGQALSPSAALSKMYTMVGGQFERDDLERFVRCMTVYPAGSLVRLSTGEAALVLRTNQAAPTAPLVRIVRDRAGHPPGLRILDLAVANASVVEAVLFDKAETAC